jgi:hypothetical protein
MEAGKKFQTDDCGDYQDAFRKKVFRLLKMGYDALHSKSFKNYEEEDITGEIVEIIKKILESRKSPKWAGHFSIHEEPPINAQSRKGKRRKRIDIEFEWTRRGVRPRYPFEAKRLCKNTHATMGEYLGAKGLGEFVSGHYAGDKDEAGMLGYIQSDTPEFWGAKAQKKFEKEPEKINACSDGNWTEAVIIEELPHCFYSKHHRASGDRPIEIYHAFFVFC